MAVLGPTNMKYAYSAPLHIMFFFGFHTMHGRTWPG
jgi:hypothetical protein